MTSARHSDQKLTGPRGSTAEAAVHPRGFSLAELVLALGVLAIGLTMAAALFPAAMKLNEQSTRDSVGTIIATNGLAIARAILEPNAFTLRTDPNNLGEPNWQACAGDPNLLLSQLLYQPDPNAGPTTRGSLVLGRPLGGGCYQLVIVSYDRFSPAGTVTAEAVQINDVATLGGTSAVALDRPDLADCTGAVLVWASNVPTEPKIIYAKITGRDPGSGRAILDHTIENITQPTAQPGTAFVIVEKDGGTTLTKSPVMTVLVADTALAG